MTYLELINKVLGRLREDKIVSTGIDSTPFYTMIGACVNDAKEAVENAYDWSHLRGEEEGTLVVGDEDVTIAGSGGTSYLVKSVLNVSKGQWRKEKTQIEMRNRYMSDGVTAVENSTPTEWAYHYPDSATGDVVVRLYPRPDATDTLRFYRVKHQPELTAHDDRLLVPAEPVFLLATALAARERGEVQGTPVSELLQLAKGSLSDKIALDAARFPYEEDWYNPLRPEETNVRYY